MVSKRATMNSASGAGNRKLSLDELKKVANKMRAYALIAIHNAKSGHSGGSLSAMDLVAAAYLNKMKINPRNPKWEGRDRFFFSKAHASPATYAALAMSGFFDIEEMMTFRKLNSKFQGHPDMNDLAGIESSGGSLGQGLSIAVGSAIAAKIKGLDYKVYCLMGDGEQEEGSIWEAVMSASNFKLDNLIGIVDKNKFQIDGSTEKVMDLGSLSEKYKSFGWHVIEIDGHDMHQILDAYDNAIKNKGKPSVIIANTIKGKGASFMENKEEWHSKAPNYEQLMQALKELKCEDMPIEKLIKRAVDFEKKMKSELEKSLKFKGYGWNLKENMKVEIESTRDAFGKAVSEIKEKNPKIVIVSADSYKSLFRLDYEKFDFKNKKGIINLGIAEQNMTNVSAGLAKEGFIPIMGAYGVFSCGRNWEQIRNTICLSNFNVKIVGIGGLTIGGDGASHEALEELFLTTCLPNMKVFVPCDSIETEKMIRKIVEIEGPCYMRIGKHDFPIITKKETPFELGRANIIRFRGEKEKFKEAFDFYLSSNYKSEKEDLAIIAYGLMAGEAMRAAYILKKDYGIETRVINMHTIKPLDKNAIEKVAEEIEFVIVAEEHQIGGLGNLIAKEMMSIPERKTKKIEMIGMNDEFGKSGGGDDLIKYFGLNAEKIVEVAKNWLNIKR